MNAYRLATGGRIDRQRPTGFTFNGTRYQGFAGDTLASALLANGVQLVGRSFKYHRPRGIFSAGAEEPNALVQLGAGAQTEPNVRATQVELYEGLTATSQNCWPSVGLDLGEAANLLAPLFPAGFYYKTFMWPPSFWHLYERLIRRAAGMGEAPRARDPDRYEHVHAHCDVLVVGGGPAGLAAALAAGAGGARVILADEQTELGGSLLSEPADHPALPWREASLAALRARPETRLLTRTTAFGYYDHNFLGLLERVTDHLGPAAPAHLPRQRLWKVRARQVVLATGAIERPAVFGGNDRPGVMLASAVRSYLWRYAVRPGRTVLFTNNDSAYATAHDLFAAEVGVTVVDSRPDPGIAAARAEAAGIRVLAGHAVVATKGHRKIRTATIRRLREGRIEGTAQVLPCDLLAVSGGWNPTIHLQSQSRARPAYDEDRALFVPGPAIQAERSAGACNGAFTLAACLDEGASAGIKAAEAAGFRAERPDLPTIPATAEAPAQPLWQVPSEKGKAFVDLQNDVTAADIGLALARRLPLGRACQALHHHRHGHRPGQDQQRQCAGHHRRDHGPAGAGDRGHDLPATLYAGAVRGDRRTQLRHPVRSGPPHADACLARGARCGARGRGPVEAPLVLSPGRRDHGGSASRARSRRRAPRSRSWMPARLGKIDLQGRDVAELLNRVYTNAWSKLAIGRCRYGLMLGEDGMVFDDGVTTRLGERHYLMSTTSGGAARVLAWLEEWLQTEWPELQVYATSVTDQWATISLSGPECRKLMAELVPDVDLDPAAFPHMSMREGRVRDAPARIFRISFTGELGYEIQVPASHGLDLWQHCMAVGARYGITPYGTEAMHVLRAEKGYIIAGQDTDGTVTPFDLGMDWIVSKSKPDFIGKRSLARADMTREGRKQLVGLLPDDPHALLEEGAQIVASPGSAIPMAMIGHVTSSYRSPHLGRSFALALVERGRERQGQKLYVAMPDQTITVTVTAPGVHRPRRRAAPCLRLYPAARDRGGRAARRPARRAPRSARSRCAAIRARAASWRRSAGRSTCCCRTSPTAPAARAISPPFGRDPMPGW